MSYGKAIIIEAHDADAIGWVVNLVRPIDETIWIVPGGLSFLDTGWHMDRTVRNSCGEYVDTLPSRFLRRLVV